jgi:adenine-specific DNA-methyltransferase
VRNLERVRYIGNKTRLLGFIARVLRARGIRGGTAVDPFSGTASVARRLKARGFSVIAADIMSYAHVFARAYVEVPAIPDVAPLAASLRLRGRSLSSVVRWLDRLPPAPGFIHEHYSPEGEAGRVHGRMYFTPDNAARIDGIRAKLEEWRRESSIDDDLHDLLLAALLEAADRVANTTGVYAAYVKSWQPNAVRPLELRVPRVVPGNGCHAVQADALDLVPSLDPFDLLYLDPPYNARQYAGYYHIPELIANGWFDASPTTRGKTGLLEDTDKRSDWSRAGRCEDAFERLIAGARCRHVMMSYNAEGIIPEATIERVLRTYGRAATFRRYRTGYRRYRSDRDGENRRYAGDRVEEYLYCVDKA